jgi:hypothetical protein
VAQGGEAVVASAGVRIATDPLPVEGALDTLIVAGGQGVEAAAGIHYTIVNGQVLMEDGKHTGAPPAACCATPTTTPITADRRRLPPKTNRPQPWPRAVF